MAACVRLGSVAILPRFRPPEEAEERPRTSRVGAGLGLAITHDIITAHGGTIEIQSTVGSGTTVRITLPPAS